MLDLSPPGLPALRPITGDDYHAMIRAGIFRPDERVELLDGHLVPMTALGIPHLIATNRVAGFFSRVLVESNAYEGIVSTQGSIRLGDRSELEPDVALLRPAYDAEMRHPTAADALLVVEVAGTSLAFDRGAKRDRYARAGIAETWIVALDEGWVEAAFDPQPDGYATVHRFTPNSRDPLVPRLLPGLPPIDLQALFRGLPV